jgi:hypothetical protein
VEKQHTLEKEGKRRNQQANFCLGLQNIVEAEIPPDKTERFRTEPNDKENNIQMQEMGHM